MITNSLKGLCRLAKDLLQYLSHLDLWKALKELSMHQSLAMDFCHRLNQKIFNQKSIMTWVLPN